jgi:hypothetical protein
MNEFKMITHRPLPMPATESFIKAFDKAIGDPDKAIQSSLEKEFKFGYRSGIGEIIYAMVTARPDVSTATGRCTQNSACPAREHYMRHILKYLSQREMTVLTLFRFHLPPIFWPFGYFKVKSAFLPSHFSRAFHVRTMTRHPIGTMMDGHHPTHPRTTTAYQSMVYDVYFHWQA